MRARSLLVVAVLGLVGGCGSVPAARQAHGPPLLRATGVGAVAFGAALAETELMVGEKAVGQDTGAACRYVQFPSLPGLRFTVLDGVVTRADAGPGVANVLGVHPGDTTDAVLSLFPEVRVRPDRESLGGSNLVLADPGGRHAIVMQAAGDKIVAIRAGLLAAVESHQGCP